MTTRYFGAPVPRNEDARLLTGGALFVDDVELPGLLHAAFVRSPHAHARIRGIDVSAAAPARKACSPCIPRRTSASTGSPGRCSCRRRRSTAPSSTSAPRCRSPGTRCATRASRWRSSSPRAVISRKTRRPRWRSTTSRLRPWWTSSTLSRPMRRACTTTSRAMWRRTCARRAATMRKPRSVRISSCGAASSTTGGLRRPSRRAA